MTVPTCSCWALGSALWGEAVRERSHPREWNRDTEREHPTTRVVSLMQVGLKPAAPLDFQVCEQLNSLSFA